jgi:hypothetical protein
LDAGEQDLARDGRVASRDDIADRRKHQLPAHRQFETVSPQRRQELQRVRLTVDVRQRLVASVESRGVHLFDPASQGLLSAFDGFLRRRHMVYSLPHAPSHSDPLKDK